MTPSVPFKASQSSSSSTHPAPQPAPHPTHAFTAVAHLLTSLPLPLPLPPHQTAPAHPNPVPQLQRTPRSRGAVETERAVRVRNGWVGSRVRVRGACIAGVSRVEGRAGAREAVGGAPVRLVRRDVAVGVVGYGVVVGEGRGVPGGCASSWVSLLGFQVKDRGKGGGEGRREQLR
jgi:hypothetical protein